MKKHFLSLFTFLSIIFLPQNAFAHFESPHEPFWHEPMHFIVEHYIGIMLIALGVVAVAVLLKKKPEKNNEKIK